MASTASRLERRQVTTGPAGVDVSGLKRALERAVTGEVRFDAGTRAMYANDFSIYRAVPIGVVIPTGPDDVIAAIAICREYQAPVLPRGCGTAPSGQTTNVAVVFDYSKYYNEIVELDPDIRQAVVQPGVICDQLRNAAEEYDLTYGPDPATHEYCTFGGMLGNNSCGTHSLMAGKTSDNVLALDVLLYDGTRMTVGPTTDEGLEEIIAAGGRKGEIYDQLRKLRDRVADRVRAEFPDIPRRVSGYNLDQLLPENGFNVARALVGSEGTCANILHATVRLVPSPQQRRTLLLGYPDVFQAADHVPVILERTRPIGLEGFDDQLIKNMIAKDRLAAERTLLPAGRAWLYVEFGRDDPDEVEEETRRALELLADGPQIDAKVIVDKLDQVSIWKVRESAVGDSRAPGYMDAEGNWEDAAVHPNKLGAYLRDFQQILDDHGYRCVYYGHFGQGCVHTRMDFDLKSAAGVKTFRSFMEKCADLVVAYGGSLAGEYGEGHGRAELLPKMFGPELMEAFNDFKRIWDPDWKMNPNRLIGDVKLDEGLRLGPDYRPPELKTHFAFPDDGGSFATAIERCFGMAKCRNLGSLTMCPSFHATREERHSTRGRSRLLFEMLKGDPVTDGWRDEAVKESLDLCLSCKGCTGDCPVQVDIPTYKAEFLAHYYAKRRRPLHHYALGLLPWWGQVAARTPRLVNGLSASPPIARPVKRWLEIAQEREIPKFAKQTFRDWFADRSATTAAPGAAPGERAPARRAVAGHVHRPVRARRRQGRGRGARGRRVRGRGAAQAPVLRTAAVRLRDAHTRQAHPSKRPRDALGADRSRRPGARARAELRLGVPRRAAQADAPRRARAPAHRPDDGARRAARSPRARMDPAERRTPRADPRPLPPQGGDPRRSGTRPAHPRRRRGRDDQGGLLRDGRVVRLRRRRAVRRLDADRRAVPAALGPGSRGRHAAGGRRILVPDADHRRHGPARAPHRRGARARPLASRLGDCLGRNSDIVRVSSQAPRYRIDDRRPNFSRRRW